MSLHVSAIPQVGIRALELTALPVHMVFASKDMHGSPLVSHGDHAVLVTIS